MPRRQDLRAMLTDHRPGDDTERAHQQRMLGLCDLRHEDGDPFARSHFEPGHFTASGFVLSPSRDALLLIHHRKLGRWLQPGGHVDADDADLMAAARREVREEVGLGGLTPIGDGPFDLDVHAIPQLGAEPPHAHFDVRFLFLSPSHEHAATEEVREARWFPLQALRSSDADASVMRVVRKLLEPR